MGDRDTADVREAFASLSRSLKRISVYRHAADQHRSYMEPAYQALRDVLSRRPGLTVAVEPSGLRFQDEVVYTEPPRESGFCFRLHRDGLRSLTFRQGLQPDDLLALARVALVDPAGGGPREDSITELWKLDLEHVTYVATSGYQMDQAGGEALARDIADVAVRAHQTLERNAGSGFAEHGPPPPLWSNDQRARRDPQDWTALARRAAFTILRIVEQEQAGWDLEALQESFWRLLDEMATRGDVQDLALSLDRTRKLEGSHAGEFRAAVGRNLADPRLLELAIKLGAAERPPLLPAWLALLPPEAGPAVVALLPLGATSIVREQLAAAAIARMNSCSAQIDATLRQGALPVVQALLASATEPGRRSEFALIATGNGDLAVKLEVIPHLAATEHAARFLGSILSSPSREARLAAVQMLGSFAAVPEASAAHLISAISRPAFGSFDREEQELCCRALGRLGTTTGFSFLFERLSRPPRGLFGRRKGESGQLLAVQGLAEEASQRSLRALEEALLPSRGHGPAVVAACRAAAQHVRAAVRSGRSA
jgi:hypothetical protein